MMEGKGGRKGRERGKGGRKGRETRRKEDVRENIDEMKWKGKRKRKRKKGNGKKR